MIIRMNFVFLLAGIISCVLQTLLLREIFVVFEGNELSIGIVLSHWLLGVGMGSYLTAGTELKKYLSARTGLIFSFVAVSAYSVTILFIIRNLRLLLNIFPGEGFSLFAMTWSSAVIILPLAALVGSQFSFGVRVSQELDSSSPAGTIYLWESIGYLFGGIFLTYLLLPYLSSSQIMLIIAFLCIVSGFMLAKNELFKFVLSLAGLFVLGLIFWGSKSLETSTLSNLYSGFNVLEAKNSPYGQIAVAQRDNERYFISNGAPILSLPGEDTSGLEEFGYLPLLFCRDPQKILLIGSAGKYIPAILKHRSVKRLDYAELDPQLVKFLEKYANGTLKQELGSPKVSVQLSDGRLYIRNTQKLYDVVLIGLNYPLTMSINRFYTKEFFSMLKDKLAAGGIIALKLPGSEVYLDNPIVNLNSTIRQTLEKVFPDIRVIPGDENIFIASKDISLPPNKEIKMRFLHLKPDTNFISAPYIDFKLDSEKEDWLNNKLKKGSSLLNTDFAPKGVFASLIYWQSIFAPKSALIYGMLAKYSFILWIAVIFWLVKGGVGTSGTVFSTGAAAMGLQMLSIWGLQVFSGYLYHWIGMATAAFMAGTSFGVWFIIRKQNILKENRILPKIEITFCIWIIFWWVLMKFGLIVWQIFFIFSFGSGILLGLEFPILVKLQAKMAKSDESAAAGKLYSMDLLGGWIAALVGGTLLIPAWGFEKTILLILLLKVTSARCWAIPSASRNCSS